jgi:hypothetical protein
MRAILFFSRFTLLCNLTFLLFIFFRWREAGKPLMGGRDTVISLPFLKETIIVLGFSAIVINLAMNITYLICFLSGKLKLLPRWLLTVNALFLLIQFYYFFLS